MLVREVALDSSDAKIRWADDQPGFCHLLNATSSFMHHLETFLNKAVRQSRKGLDAAAHPELDTDVSIFCAQEGWHAKLHAKFNTKLVQSGYPWIGHRVQVFAGHHAPPSGTFGYPSSQLEAADIVDHVRLDRAELEQRRCRGHTDLAVGGFTLTIADPPACTG
ncbi:metal-dependent hydrolase [Mycobacterium paraense]|uniref:metal-dependent hydrolase n=1 Tax=Mycobacterium paraense TaxID=767916 RepID=UPI000A15B5F6|nr:metal-dependent hydrolase [Mycobacterium paraense]MCV7440816.1 metal-dependent hydrolase [Mycobacterium paraense]ORW35274.1 hypothetical protein AWB89_03830 [Mycobacterium paraense]